MSHKTRSAVGLAAAATAAISLVGAGAGIATGTPAASHAKASATLKVTGGKGLFKVSGPRTFAAGLVDLSIKGTNRGAAFQIVKFKKGYSFKHYVADYKAAQGGNKKSLKILNSAVSKTTFYGGLSVNAGSSETGTTVLPKAGTYYGFNDAGNFPKNPVKLTVTGKSSNGGKVATDATVKAKSHDSFGGAATLPAKGTIRFQNVSKGSTKSPHFLVLQHVKDGTTKKDIEDYFASGSQAPPPFAEQGDSNTEVVNPGLSQTMTYSMPKGTYAELCFFPDLKTGMPHAYMGMIKIVTLS